MWHMNVDFDLLDRWRAGSSDAGNELFERRFASICRFFENKLSGDVEELVQATFLACVESSANFRKQSSFRTFLFSIARYQLYRYLRRRKGHGELDFNVTSLADLNTSPRSKLARNQEHELLLRALCLLPLEQQLLLELFYWEDMDSAALAQVFDIAEVTVRTRLFRARQVLREQMTALASNPESVSPEHAENFDEWARSLRNEQDG
jgi:RNA polymerase sigma-70 factor (ECF subfamily)